MEELDELDLNYAKQDGVNIIMYMDCKPGVTYITILSMFMVFFTNFSFSSYVFFILIFFFEDPLTFNMQPE